MSDRYEDIADNYRHVLSDHCPRRIGLFPIPEYPETERSNGGMWSTALDTILTTLRYLAPATLITLFWGQQSFLFRILKHIDLAIRTIVFSSNEQKESVLKWLSEAGPVRVERLDTVWKHGWILCGVLDQALPGACAGHPPTKMTLKHAQTIAEHYLAVEPVFSDQELETNESLSRHEEWRLATYLDRVREAIAKIPPPVSKPPSQRTSPDASQFTLDYAARGGGLTAAQVNNKMSFKIYPTAQQSLEPGDITVLIKGPKDTYGLIVISPVLGKAQRIRQTMLKLNKEPHYTENILPITQGATYLRSYGKNNIKKTFHVPRTNYDIEIEVESTTEYAKVSYTVILEGKYEIAITSRGQCIVGSPFLVTASRNFLRDLEKDSFCLEDGEEIDIVDIKTDRKVVLRIVDFVTEKMLLREDGALERITDDDAQLLMADTKQNLNKDTQCTSKCSEHNHESKPPITQSKYRLRDVAIKVVLMLRICKKFRTNENKKDKKAKVDQKETKPVSRSQIAIPDVVNSTLTDPFINPYKTGDKSDKIIIPEQISVSLQTEKRKIYQNSHRDSSNFISDSFGKDEVIDTFNNYVTHSHMFSTSNPFLNVSLEQKQEVDTIIIAHSSDYENNDETDFSDAPIKILIEEDYDTPKNVSPSTNPFMDNEIIERPKTPVLKIITGEVGDRADSVYVDPRTQHITEEILQSNEFINPFFIHQHSQSDAALNQVTDFIIGAPVTLPPIVNVPTPEPDMESLMITCNDQSFSFQNVTEDNAQSVFSTPLHTKYENSSLSSSTFHSVDSDNPERDQELKLIRKGNNLCNNIIKDILTSKKEMWDSAYVSIDETNCSPDNNNNDNLLMNDISSKQRYSPSNTKPEDLVNLGPAEQELWQSCSELNEETPVLTEEIKISKWDLKRPTFTPIIEESDRSMSTIGLRDLPDLETAETDPVSVAFAELNDVFHEYSSNSEQSSISNYTENTRNNETSYIIEQNYVSVNSASERASDVKRQANTDNEGKISEVQSKATESLSVSQNLSHTSIQNKRCTKFLFGEEKLANIVLEKKHFWDEKIRQIEEEKCHQAEEAKREQIKKKRLSSKHLRHNDSLTKRKGKQIVKNFLVATENIKSDEIKGAEPEKKVSDEVWKPRIETETTPEENNSNLKLVEKWKQFWDVKLETQEEEIQTTCFRAKSNKSKEIQDTKPKLSKKTEEKNLTQKDDNSMPPTASTSSFAAKPIVPEEIMFKAFETSPKRFFGTSRKQILSKIDAFLGKTSTNEDDIDDVSDGGEEKCTSIVSNRINLFRNISQNEDSIRDFDKSTSMTSNRHTLNPDGRKKTVQDEIKELFNAGKIGTKYNDTEKVSDKIEMEIQPLVSEKYRYDKMIKGAKENAGKIGTISNKEKVINKIEKGSKHLACEKDEYDQIINEVSSGKIGTKCHTENENGNKHLMCEKDQYDKIVKVNDAPIDKSVNNKENENKTTVEIKDEKPTKNLHEKNVDQNEEDNSYVKPVITRKITKTLSLPAEENMVKKTINKINRQASHISYKYVLPNKGSSMKKSLVSRSEMDIFSKIGSLEEEDEFDKYKSYDELPKVNVKSFISLYETVSKTSKPESSILTKTLSRTSSVASDKLTQQINSMSGGKTTDITQQKYYVNDVEHKTCDKIQNDTSGVPKAPPRRKRSIQHSSQESLDTRQSSESLEAKIEVDQYVDNNKKDQVHEEKTFLSISDMEVEIVDHSPDLILEATPERQHSAADYRSRFKMAKQYFQSLEELRDEVKKPEKLNECEKLLYKSNESLENERTHKKIRKTIKAYSVPSSELCKIWDQMKENDSGNGKLLKISEKFNVDDLFNDVVEGKLSRQGSLRGIPHKKAVLETFKSMENVSDTKLSPYEIAVSQLSEFAKENKIKNVQTYLTEYPYLPMTDPSKYHSRLDTKASGLISMKELLDQKPRRNSVPDMILNTKFSADF